MDGQQLQEHFYRDSIQNLPLKDVTFTISFFDSGRVSPKNLYNSRRSILRKISRASSSSGLLECRISRQMQSAKIALIFVTYVTIQCNGKMYKQGQRLKQPEKQLGQERHFQEMVELSLTMRIHNIILIIIRFTIVVGRKTISILILATYFVISLEVTFFSYFASLVQQIILNSITNYLRTWVLCLLKKIKNSH